MVLKKLQQSLQKYFPIIQLVIFIISIILNIVGIIIWGVWYYEKAPTWGHDTGIGLAITSFIILLAYTICYQVANGISSKKDVLDSTTTPVSYNATLFLHFIKEYFTMIPLTSSMALFISIIEGFSIMDLFDNELTRFIIITLLLVIIIIGGIYFYNSHIYRKIHCNFVKSRDNSKQIIIKCSYLLILFVPFFLMILNMFGYPTEANTIQKVFAGIYIVFYSIGFLFTLIICVRRFSEFRQVLKDADTWMNQQTVNIKNFIEKYESKEITINELKCNIEKETNEARTAEVKRANESVKKIKTKRVNAIQEARRAGR